LQTRYSFMVIDGKPDSRTIALPNRSRTFGRGLINSISWWPTFVILPRFIFLCCAYSERLREWARWRLSNLSWHPREGRCAKSHPVAWCYREQMSGLSTKSSFWIAMTI